MIMNNIEEYCSNMLLDGVCRKLPFHNLAHTEEVVRNVKKICYELQINSKETELIIIAAWFHDVGFSKVYYGHEEVSMQFAKVYLENIQYESHEIEIVLSCINATKMPQQPESLYEKILCDADMFHVGTPHFFYRNILLRQEWKSKNIMAVTDSEWYQINLEFLHNFHFHTKYGVDFLEKEKLVNEHKIKDILNYY